MRFSLRGLAALSSLLPLALAHGANTPEPLGEPGCRIADITPRPMGDAVSWSGACKDGYAEGKGVLAWRVSGEGKRKLQATLARGEISGEGTLDYAGGQYIGSFRQGMPHGSGYFAYAKSGDQYEGGVVDGVREGTGVMVAVDGSTYEGQWKAGKRHGRGKAKFKLGGSYEGDWHEGRMHGKGTIVYGGSGRTYTGEFRDNRAVGAVPAPTDDEPQFGLNEAWAETGFQRPAKRPSSPTPMDKVWAAMTPAQQNIIRNGYPALDDRDEPPYPLQGLATYYKGISELYRKIPEYEGNSMIYLTVGADGVPTSVTTYGITHKEFGRYVSMVAMMQRFKPALCAGTPCAMVFPLRFQFTLE
jgi:hypothetical protein